MSQNHAEHATHRLELEPAGFFPRLMSMIYESLILLAILFLADAVVLLIRREAVPPGALWHQLYLVGVLASYFSYCFMRSGQTVGMFAWRTLLTDSKGQRPTLTRALLRFLTATLCGFGVLGLLWMWVDRDKLALQDRLSQTRVLRLPKVLKS
jgi:uncharacterized RDD family membrane protein YckC